jgi:hypothetical protein
MRMIVMLVAMLVIVMPMSGRRAATSSRTAQLARRHNIPSLLAYRVPNLRNARSVVLLTTTTLN